MIRGFTLIEILITLVIIAILATIGVPSYFHYSNKAKFSEAIQIASSLKHAVALCVITTGELHGCMSGEEGIPSAVYDEKNIASSLVNHTPPREFLLPHSYIHEVLPW